MPKPYSYDLRIKVMKFLSEGGAVKEASILFNIARKTIIEWKKIVKATGDVKAKENYHKPHRRIIKETDRFKKFIEQNCSKSAKELALAWHQKISASAIVRFLKKLGYTYKKSLYPSKKGGWSQK